jgi:hypothetical protein
LNSAREYGEGDIGGDDVHMIRLHDLARERNRHGYRRFLGKNLGQQAFVPGVEMLDHDIGHAGRRRKGAQQLDDCFESSGRGSDAYDRQCHVRTDM